LCHFPITVLANSGSGITFPQDVHNNIWGFRIKLYPQNQPKFLSDSVPLEFLRGDVNWLGVFVPNVEKKLGVS